MTDVLLEVVDIHKRYGRRIALEKVSFSVRTGELFGLLGPNGAGKTTLLTILAGLAHAYDGTVRLAGQTLNPNDRRQRRLIGIAPQELALYDELTAAENLRFFGELYGIESNELADRVRSILTAIGLSDRAHHRVGTFSGGMKRRLNLGVAVVHRPLILFLDEPTTGVDPQSRHHIFEEVRRLNAEGLTVVYTSHYMEEVQSLCPRVAIIDHGRVVACDSVADLLRRHDTEVRFQSAHVSVELLASIRQSDDITLQSLTPTVAFTCREPGKVLPRLFELAGRQGITLHGLEVREPNLERVFLALTGHDLRD